jgi:AbiJ N-terminal domain 4
MAVIDLFSKRQRQQARHPLVYKYEPIPHPFRIQVIHIWLEALGPYVQIHNDWGLSAEEPPLSNHLWKLAADSLSREWGLIRLAGEYDDPSIACQKAILAAETERVIDLIEVTFRLIERVVCKLDEYEIKQTRITALPDDAIAELNQRFHEHELGYQYLAGIVIREDSAVVQQELVEPAIALLHQVGFAGPNDEYLRAHDHYRQGRYPEAVTEANKAFESTMKAICTTRKWPIQTRYGQAALTGSV